MPYQSRWAFSPLCASIPDCIFNSSEPPTFKDDDRIYLDARRPDTHFWTMGTLRESSMKLAAGLRRLGLEQGQRVALFAGNSIDSPMVVMGTIMAGGIYTSINPGYTIREVSHQMRDCLPSFLLVAPECLSKAVEAASDVGIDQKHVFVFSDPRQSIRAASEEMQHWSTIFEAIGSDNGFAWPHLDSRDAAEETALLAYSSGTTGLPKGVEISHYQIVNNIQQIKQVLCADSEIQERRGLCALPFYHGLGLLYYCLAAPALGLVVYLMERYNVEGLMRYIERHRITEVVLVPPMVLAMVKYPDAIKGNIDMSSLRKVVCGAAPLGKDIAQQFEQIFDDRLRIQQAWGMSEAPAISIGWDERERSLEATIAVGELLPGLEARLMGDDGSDLAGKPARGELWIRGPNVFRQYWRNPAATAETLTPDAWLKTGDVALIDENGKWSIVDRKKELIKVRGAQVAPAEVEALLLEHPQIIDAAVIGMKTADADEAPRAYVVILKRNNATWCLQKM